MNLIYLVPIIGWLAIAIIVTIALWRIFEKRKYPGWLGLSYVAMFIPKLSGIGNIVYYIIIGFVAWKDK